MKRKGSSIIFINHKNEILLLLRDNIPTIPYPNMWDLPSGHVEENETPEECIIREMKEELNIILNEFNPFAVDEFKDRIEYTFWKKVNFDIDQLKLNEGQMMRPISIFDGQRFTIYDEKLKVTRHDTVARYAILG